MNKTEKKKIGAFVSLFLALTLSLGAISGCGQTEKNEVSSKTAQSAVVSSETEPEETPDQPFENIKEGDTVYCYVQFHGINMEGVPARVAAYDYYVSFDNTAFEYVGLEDMTTGGEEPLDNMDDDKTVHIAHIAMMGFKQDFTGDSNSTCRLIFKAKKDVKNESESGFDGKCTSLTAASMDGKDILNLVGKKHPDDPYSGYALAKKG